MSVSSAKILLLGGGYTLERVATQLPRHSFVITSRNFEKVRAWQQKGWLACVLDITEPSTLKGALEQHPKLATIVDSIPPARINTDHLVAARELVKQIRNSSIKRAIYLSTTGVYGVEDGSIVDETTATNPKHESGKARLAFETAYLESFNECTVLRISAIYGPGRGTGHALRDGRYPYIDNGKRWSNRIHVDDLAKIIQEILNKNCEQKILCISDGNPALTEDIVKYYCSTFGLNLPNSITTSEAKERGMHTVLSNQRINSALVYQLLDIKPQYPSFKEGAKTEFHESN